MTLLVILASVWLAWTAPGDDGNVGQASYYVMRLALEPIAEADFDNHYQVPTGPPSPAGQPDSVLVSGLLEGRTYYIALKAVDDAGNRSAMSNVVAVTVRDTIPPAAIDDLEAR